VLFAARDYISGDTFRIVRCGACGLARTDPVPSESDRYYPAAYFATPGVRRFPWWAERWQRFLYGRRVARVARLLNVSPGRVLDIGCGPGFLLKEFQQRGWEAHGTELNEMAAAHARQQLGLSVTTGRVETLPFPPEHFDAVVLWHVLEHLLQPHDMLAEAARLLRPGGILLVGVPNFGSLEARFAQEKWFHLDVPRHLVHFDRVTLTQALAGAGLKVEVMSWMAPEYDTFSFAQSALNSLGLRHNLLLNFLRGRQSKVTGGPAAPPLQVAASLFLAFPLGALAVPATLAASFLRSGSSLTVYCRK
jgi:SAM-dependent methyltransferase